MHSSNLPYDCSVSPIKGLKFIFPPLEFGIGIETCFG